MLLPRIFVWLSSVVTKVTFDADFVVTREFSVASFVVTNDSVDANFCLLYRILRPRDVTLLRMPVSDVSRKIF